MVAVSSARRQCSLLVCTGIVGLSALSHLWVSLGNSAAEVPGNIESDRIHRLASIFDELRLQHQNLTSTEFLNRIGPGPDYLRQIPFDPAAARYFDLVDRRLQLTDSERELFRQNGFVSIDQGRGLSFPAAYQQVYTSDLPVFISSDSILHALHRSYDDILKELETTSFHDAIDQVLVRCQGTLAKRASTAPAELRENFLDVDLYVGVARKLLKTPPQSISSPQPTRRNRPVPRQQVDSPATVTFSLLGQEELIDSILTQIEAANEFAVTTIYGSQRKIDYTQFRPRGHYVEGPQLGAYFRCMMWLSRADCGWTVTPTPGDGSQTQALRELRDAALLTELLHESGAIHGLTELDQVLEFFVGRSDNFGALQVKERLLASQIESAQALQDQVIANQLQRDIQADPRYGQLIRSQILEPAGGTKPTPLPVIFQLMGQRFVIDSLLLSKVVHDEIVYHERKIPRHRPTGLDVMAALGNHEATVLLSSELEQWKYSSNLLACRELVDQLKPDFWVGSLHHSWLDCLRSLDADLTSKSQAPAAMRTRAWQRKQLQTQLASWAELRRDNILYAKQSYGVPGCMFPCGYVEPYPEFFGKLRDVADRAREALKRLSLNAGDAERQLLLEKNCKRQISFFEEMSVTMQMLEQIATAELEKRSLSEAQQSFLRSTFDDSGSVKFGSGSQKDFSGWYCRLYYSRSQDINRWEPETSKPVIADVHTNVHGEEVLEVATGSVRLMVIAIEGERDSTVYVGPVSSSFEFWQPAEKRLNDQEWRHILATNPPSSPEWASLFEAQPVRRNRESPRVQVYLRKPDEFSEMDEFSVTIERDGEGTSGLRMAVSPATVKELAEIGNLHALDLHDCKTIDDEALRPLAKLSDLRSLRLRGTKLSDKGLTLLKNLRSLQSLDLSQTAISDAALPTLSSLIYLSHVDLRGTQVTPAGVRELRERLPHAEILH